LRYILKSVRAARPWSRGSFCLLAELGVTAGGFPRGAS
jgi:hypothetical protein